MSSATVGIAVGLSIRGASTITSAIPSRSRKESVLGAVLLLQPARVPELDQQGRSPELLLRLEQVVESGVLADDVGRKLEEDPAQLAGVLERRDSAQEAAEDLGTKLLGRMEDTPLLVDLGRGAKIGWKLLEPGWVACHQRESLDVEEEAGRRTLGPAGAHARARQPVVGRVDLDRVEALRVEVEPFLRRQPVRVPVLDQRLVGKGAGADANGAHGRTIFERSVGLRLRASGGAERQFRQPRGTPAASQARFISARSELVTANILRTRTMRGATIRPPGRYSTMYLASISGTYVSPPI